MRISLIVPMYNVEQYLEACLDSLKAQTLSDMEILLIDDGSTDHTSGIARRYAQQDTRFRYYRKPNGGLSDARNYGIPLTRGEYIAFLDSDDWVESDLYARMSEAIGTADVLVTDIEYRFAEESKNFLMKGLSDWDASSIQKKALLSPLFAWNKLYKRDWFMSLGLRYPEGLWYEDLPVTTLVFARANDIAYLTGCPIHYRQREGSIMASKNDERLGNIFEILDLVRRRFKENGLSTQYHEELEYLHIEHLRLYGMFRFIRSDRTEEYYAKSEEVMKRNFPGWKNNRYIANLNLKNRLFLQYYSPKTAWLFHPLIRK